ncbi:lactate utilization protein [Vermiculatibacterium agrestimuris]|uniref:lactate utilization protein n=1 Tax=Vermiculatibacterium agrestimuris TaxID=2941519 RepID=UPI0020406FA9|nr:lactate utilization protein [Vermiculatibacterium agrestimuris]
MPNLDKLTEILTKNGFTVHRFATATEAAAYIDAHIDGKTVGFGGSVTLQDMGLYDLLSAHNTVHWHWGALRRPDTQEKAAAAQVYLTSVNGLAETGEIINIDGHGNRVAATICGHEEVWFIVGVNKIAPDLAKALWRARNIAGPKNAQRLGKKTPCAAKGDRCYDCDSPERICRVISTHLRKPTSIPTAHVVLIEEEIGY